MRVSVGQTSGVTQRASILDSARELAIRDAHAVLTTHNGLSLGFAHGLGHRSIVAALVKQLVCELVDEQHGAVSRREQIEDRDAAWL